MTRQDHRIIAMDLVQAALTAVDPLAAVCRFLRLDRDGGELRVGDCPPIDLRRVDRVVVVGAGKASVAMARGVESILGADRIAAGAIIAKAGQVEAQALPETIEVLEAAHPVPDRSSVESTEKVLSLLGGLTRDDLVLALISGGGSSLMMSPVAGVALADLEALGTLLLASGVSIDGINAVRKHLDRVKGGQLAAAATPARVVSLILSDVVGNPLDVIASGPTAPDPTTFSDALGVLERIRPGLDGVPEAVQRWLRQGVAGKHAETPKPGEALFDAVHNQIIGSNELAAEAVRRRARELGFNAQILSTSVEGEAREVARVYAALLREAATQGRPLARPACVVLGGETTVTLGHAPGKGGRNQELALAAALSLQGLSDVMVVALATDGNDGPTDAGGALVDGTTVARGQQRGLDARDHLERNDAYPFFDALDDLIKIGPTGTNVNDLTLLLAF
jgi:hydroxypyruvate reductase